MKNYSNLKKIELINKIFEFIESDIDKWDVLQHATSINFLEKILASGGLKPSMEKLNIIVR